jgi:hypothetical protein
MSRVLSGVLILLGTAICAVGMSSVYILACNLLLGRAPSRDFYYRTMILPYALGAVLSVLALCGVWSMVKTLLSDRS